MSDDATLWSAGSYAVAPGHLWAADSGPVRVAEGDRLAWRNGDGVPVRIDVSARIVKAMAAGADRAAVLDKLATPLGRRSLQVRDGLSGEVLLPDRSALATVLADRDDAGRQRNAVAAYNEWIAAFAATDRSRFVGVGQIPTSGLDDALEALGQCQRLGLRAVALAQPPAGPGTAPGGDAEEFWQLAGGTTLVCLVPGFGSPVDGTGNPYGPEDPAVVAGRPPAVSGFLARLAFAGIPDIVPELRVLLANVGAGWFPYVMEGADTNYQRAAASRRVALSDPNALPSEYVRRFTWTTFHEDRFAVLHRGFFGEAHLLWSAEAPGRGSDWPDDVEQSARIAAGLPDAARASLLHGNTRRLFGVDGASFTTADVVGFERSSLFS